MAEDPLKHRVVDAIAKRNLTLAGFTLTTLSIMIGFYRDDLFGAGPIIPSLLTAMIVFFLGSQFSYEAEHISEADLSDICQSVGTIILLLSFSIFIGQNFLGGVITLLIVGFGIFVVVVYLARILLRIKRTISRPRRFTEVSDNERKRSEQKD